MTIFCCRNSIFHSLFPSKVEAPGDQDDVTKHLWERSQQGEHGKGSRREVITKIFYFILFPLFLIASHSPHPSSPILHLCLLYRLTACAPGGDDEMGEAIGGDGVSVHGKKGKAGCSADFSSGLFPPTCVPGWGML